MTTAMVDQEYDHVGHVYDFTAPMYGSELRLNDLATIHSCAGAAFQCGNDFSKSQEHLVTAWYLVCRNSSTNGNDVDINGDVSTSIFTAMLLVYQTLLLATPKFLLAQKATSPIGTHYR
jgi:hypothetical protein